MCQHLKQHTRFENDNEIDQTRVSCSLKTIVTTVTCKIRTNETPFSSKAPAIAIVKFTPNNGNSGSQFANELYYPPGTPSQYLRVSPYDELSRSPYEEQSRDTSSQFYGTRYPANSYNEYDPITDENKLQSERLTLDGVDERLYRTRRQPYSIGDYDDDAIESIKNALDEEKSKELVEAKELTVDAIPVDELEFLVNDKLGDRYSDQKQPRDDFDTEYEKAFSRKYKHPRKFSELAERNEFLLGSVKRNSKNDDYGNEDYEDVGGDDELPQGDAPSLENAVYTEGGMVQPSNDRSGGDAEGIL